MEKPLSPPPVTEFSTQNVALSEWFRAIPPLIFLASAIWPVGSIYIGVLTTNPATLLGFGTWEAFATGRTLVGIDAGQTEFDVVEETGGTKTHTLTTAEMPAHTHTQRLVNDALGGGPGSLGATVTNNVNGDPTVSAGGGGAHNNLQPYIVVYMWKRTA